MECVRAPDERFEKLPGWSYAPRWASVPDGEDGALRMHHVDEGPRMAPPILCLHGQPTWSYLYRKMIPLFVAAGHRVVAPDLVGFGRSDQPTRASDYTYARHVAWLRAFVETLDLRGITLICQDWGGLVGLRVVAELPDRFARVITSNTGLPDARGIPQAAAAPMRALYEKLPVPRSMLEVAQGFASTGKRRLAARSEPEASGDRTVASESETPAGIALAHSLGTPGAAPPFMHWQKHCAESPTFTPGNVLRAMCPKLTPAEAAAYDAPFPDERHFAGARRFPTLVPILPDDPAIPDNRRAWEALGRFTRPFLTAFTDSDPVTKGLDARFREEVPGAKGQPHTTIAGAGHFVQEEAGEELARIALDFIARTRA